MARILVADDDADIRLLVCMRLQHSGHDVTDVGDGRAAVQACRDAEPDLVVLDVMMPGITGLEVCKRLRQTSQVPIVMLTALGEEENRIAGLELGADDYVTKPFSPRELALRVASVLRRVRMRPEPVAAELVDGDLCLQMTARTATLRGRELPLTTREFDLLAFFLAHPGVAYSRADLLEKVWGWDFGDQSTVTVHVRRLREKIERDPAKPARVASVWGVGYSYDREQP